MLDLAYVEQLLSIGGSVLCLQTPGLLASFVSWRPFLPGTASLLLAAPALNLLPQIPSLGVGNRLPDSTGMDSRRQLSWWVLQCGEGNTNSGGVVGVS